MRGVLVARSAMPKPGLRRARRLVVLRQAQVMNEKPVRITTLDLNDDRVIAAVVETLYRYGIGRVKGAKIANGILADLRRLDD